LRHFNLSPRLARGFSLLSAYQKATTKIVVADFILPLILQTLGQACFCDLLASQFTKKRPPLPSSGVKLLLF